MKTQTQQLTRLPRNLGKDTEKHNNNVKYQFSNEENLGENWKQNYKYYKHQMNEQKVYERIPTYTLKLTPKVRIYRCI